MIAQNVIQIQQVGAQQGRYLQAWLISRAARYERGLSTRMTGFDAPPGGPACGISR